MKRFLILCALAMLGGVEPALAKTILFVGNSASASEPTWQELQNLPSWAQPVVGAKGFASAYALSTRINPYFLQGDFNSDGRLDLAVLVENRKTAEQGIAVLHAGAANAIVVGAGRAIGNGGADFSWLDAWSIAPRTPGARGDGLLVQKLESAGGVLYWDGAVYRWRQQGD